MRDPRLPPRPTPLPFLPPRFFKPWRVIALGCGLFGTSWGIAWSVSSALKGDEFGLMLQCGATALNLMVLGHRMILDASELAAWWRLRSIREAVLDNIEQMTIIALNTGTPEAMQRAIDRMNERTEQMKREAEELL